jgi:cell division protein FtsW (lipid II flippase)
MLLPMIKIKNNLKYIALTLLAFSIVWYQYDIRTALIGFGTLVSMLFFLINFVRLYQCFKQKSYKNIVWYLIGVICFSIIIFFLPDRLTRFAAAFCLILSVFYIIYDLVVKSIKSK